MPLPASLAPTIDALLSSPALCLPLGGPVSQIWGAGDRYLRAAFQSWFEIVLVREGKLHLERLDDVHALYDKDPAFFAPVLEGGFEPIPWPAEFVERASFVGTQFPPLWTELEQGTIDAEPDTWMHAAAVRLTDGTYWQAKEQDSVITYARRLTPKGLASSLRRFLWDGQSPKTRQVAPAFRARVEAAVLLETILKAELVEVELDTPTATTALENYLLEGPNAFRWEDTGEEERSMDWTNPWPEPVFAFLPFPRDEVLTKLRAESTVVMSVDYSNKHRRRQG